LIKSEGNDELHPGIEGICRSISQTPATTSILPLPMASRRLALNLTQGLRGRAGLNAVAPLRRGFATPVVKNGVKTESTTLSNGLTVCHTTWMSGVDGQLTSARLLQNTRHGPRRRPWVFGLMLDLGQRRIELMAPLISWSILPSR
jgi:hypothetical protein